MSIIFLLFFLQSARASAKTPELITPPKPSLAISLERLNIRQKDCVNAELIVANESEHELTNPSLEVSGPDLFKWYTGPCEKEDEELGTNFGAQPSLPALDLPPIAAWSTRKQELHLHTGHTIEVGEYNCLFTIQYHWKTKQGVAKSFVSAEKPIKVNFLGNESVAGIPLALAGFIIPGLLFWLIIKAFGASWSLDGLSDQMLYSVMVSIALVVVGTWRKYWDISTGISIEKLTKLAAAGAAIGVAAGLVDLGVRKIRKFLKDRELERQIVMGESESSLLGKLLELSPVNTLERPAFRANDGMVYVGALGATTELAGSGAEKGQIIHSLVGSFSISLAEAEKKQLKTRIEELHEAGRMRELMKLAKDNSLLETVTVITRMEGDAAADDESFKQWRADEVLSYATKAEGWDTPILEIK